MWGRRLACGGRPARLVRQADEAPAPQMPAWLSSPPAWRACCFPRFNPNPHCRISPILRHGRRSRTSPTTTFPRGSTSFSRWPAASPSSITTTTAGWTSSSPTAPSLPELKKTGPAFYNCLLRNKGDGDVRGRDGESRPARREISITISASPWAITITTATRTCSSAAPAATRSITTTATARSPMSPPRRVSAASLRQR